MENKGATYWEKRMLGWFKERSGEGAGDDIGNPGELIGKTIMFEAEDALWRECPWWGCVDGVRWSGTDRIIVVPASMAFFKELYIDYSRGGITSIGWLGKAQRIKGEWAAGLRGSVLIS